jgi:hypothetical protein
MTTTAEQEAAVALEKQEFLQHSLQQKTEQIDNLNKTLSDSREQVRVQ